MLTANVFWNYVSPAHNKHWRVKGFNVWKKKKIGDNESMQHELAHASYSKSPLTSKVVGESYAF